MAFNAVALQGRAAAKGVAVKDLSISEANGICPASQELIETDLQRAGVIFDGEGNIRLGLNVQEVARATPVKSRTF